MVHYLVRIAQEKVDDKTRAARERLVDLAFGYGRFRCAGQPVAFVELNKVFFEVRLVRSAPAHPCSPSS